MRDSVQTFGQSSTAVQWSSHPDSTADASTDLERRQPHRAATSPVSTGVSHSATPSPYPPSLYPGQKPPQTIHRNDIFFSPGMNYTRYDPYYAAYASGSSSVPAAAQFYPSHQQQYFPRQQPPAPSGTPPVPVPPKPPALQQEVRQDTRHAPLHPALYRSFTSPPPLPPKPSYLFEPEPTAIPTSAYLGTSSQTTHAVAAATAAVLPATSPHTPGVSTVDTAGPESDDGGDDLAVALALSKDESVREEERLNGLARQEEEELARALAASMTLVESSYDYSTTQPEAGPSKEVPSPTRSVSSPATTADSAPETGSSSLSASENNSASDSGPVQAPHSPSPASMSNRPPPEVEEGTPGNGHRTATERLSVGTSVPDGTPPTPDEELPHYSQSSTDRTPTKKTFLASGSQIVPPMSITAAHANGEDEDDEELPYLRTEGRQTPVPPAAPEEAPVQSSVSTHPSPESSGSTGNTTFTSSSNPDYDSYISEDEALARRLAEEEEAAYLESQRSNSDRHTSSLGKNNAASTTAAATGGDLPSYNDAVSIVSTDDAPVISSALPDFRIEPAPSEHKDAKGDLSRNSSINSALSISSAPVPATSSAIPFPSNGPPSVTLRPDEQRVIGRVSSMSALPVVGRPNDTSPSSDSLAPSASSRPTLHHMSSSVNLSASTTASLNSQVEAPGPSSTVGMLNPNHFVDAELLYGVSIGFTPPAVSAKTAPMQGPMPNIVSLPYGRCPPLHLAALSWRHVLKLMARLSNTRLEATVEALAVTKNETLKLRTVVQFIKPHHMTQEWRTILWFTIDHPVPSNIPNAHKYHTTNVNALPWSYTLSSIPAMLKDASDTVLSKYYAIPATNAVPFPSLPVTFPNLALYLQAALDDSRQQSESSPLHKLAKMVQTCYPNDFVDNGTEEPEKTGGVSGLFKKVIGRGNKRDRKGRGGNEETYDLVTPFVPDEWG